MTHALSATQWACPARDQNELRPPPHIVPGEVTSIAASTQVPVWPGRGWLAEDGLSRYLGAAADGGPGVKPPSDLLTSGGPLSYGVVADGDRWEWTLIVSANYQRVKLDAAQMRIDADAGGLAEEWHRRMGSRHVLGRRVPCGVMTNPNDVVQWFDSGLQQLIAAKVLERFLAGIAKERVVAEDGQ